MMAQKKSDAGAATKWVSSHCEPMSAAVTEATATPYLATIGGLDHQRGSGVVIVFQICRKRQRDARRARDEASSVRVAPVQERINGSAGTAVKGSVIR
jgi:hypothetical protein